MIPELKEVNELIEIDFRALTEDWQVMSKLVTWCDCYVRETRTCMGINKNNIHYAVILNFHPEHSSYIDKIKVYCRFHDTSEFQEFIMDRFKGSMPDIKQCELPEGIST